MNIDDNNKKLAKLLNRQSLRVYEDIVPRKMRNPPGSLFTTVQAVSSFSGNGSATITPVATVASFYAFQFELGDLSQVSTFAALFDQYRIMEVELFFRPRTNATDSSQRASPHRQVPRLYAVVDRDDNTLPTLISQLEEYDNVVTCTGYQSLHIKLKPTATRALYASGAFSGYEICDYPWVDVANTAVPGYGVKVGVTALDTSSSDLWIWDVEIYYRVAFMNTR